MTTVRPRNFSWLIKGRIAALAFPDQKEHLEFLVQEGIRYLVTLTDEMKPPVGQVPELISVDISVPDFATFSMDQVQRFIQLCEKALEEGQALAVHCRAGIGRTGTLLAIYLVRFQGSTPEDAIQQVRTARPSSIETPDQEKTVAAYYQLLLNGSAAPA